MSQIEKTTFTFLKSIKKNNNREWFTKNKDKYVEAYESMKVFFNALETEMSKHDMIDNVKVFRIYRDVRFSKDKTPYKVSLSGGLSRTGADRRGGYYLHIEPGNSMMGAGFWNPESKDLKLIRDHIAADDKRLRRILKGKKLSSTWGELHGDQLKTSPKGFDKEHPAIDLLRYKQFLFRKDFSDKEVLDKAFLKNVNTSFKAIRPYFDYMSDILTHDLNGVSLIERN